MNKIIGYCLSTMKKSVNALIENDGLMGEGRKLLLNS